MELKEHPLLYPEALLGTKHDKLSSWDVVYSLNMATACLIIYWIIIYLLSGFVDQASDFLGGMWGCRCRCFRLQGHPCACPIFGG